MASVSFCVSSWSGAASYLRRKASTRASMWIAGTGSSCAGAAKGNGARGAAGASGVGAGLFFFKNGSFICVLSLSYRKPRAGPGAGSV